MVDWQDLHHFAVLARLGSLSAAARELGVDHATVGRRVAAFEQALQLRLIDRLPRSCPLTKDGLAIAALAARMVEVAQTVRRRARGATLPLSGRVRISAPPALAALSIAPHVAELRAAHPELEIVLLGSVALAALDRGEADIAVRLLRPKEKGAVARKIGTMRFGAYAHARHAARPPAQWEFIAFDEALDHLPQQMWLRRILAGRPVAFRTNDQLGQLAAVRSGIGVAVLPTRLGEDDPDLVRVAIEPEPPPRDLWLITYPDLRRSPAIRTVMDFLAACIARDAWLRA